jgi:hypothetical protein
VSITSPSFGPGGAATAMMPARFEAMIARMGQRVSWMKGHACPCTFAQNGANGFLPLPGSASASCLTCLGLGIYWDDPTIPFVAYMKFVEMSPTPDEPGVRVDQTYGFVQLSEPSLTLPFRNPFLATDDPAQPTAAWNDASTDDIFVAVDMLSRFTAKLEVGGVTYLPYQQNLQIAPAGAVVVWNPATNRAMGVPNYSVSGASVALDPSVYPPGTAYMVEFRSAPMFVVFRPAGGIPHVRPFGAGTVNEPRRFKLQALDFWARQRGQGQQAPGSAEVVGMAFPQIFATGLVGFHGMQAKDTSGNLLFDSDGNPVFTTP